jgi:hypothetical protein
MKLLMGDVANSLSRRSPAKLSEFGQQQQSILQTDFELRQVIADLAKRMRRYL